MPATLNKTHAQRLNPHVFKVDDPCRRLNEQHYNFALDLWHSQRNEDGEHTAEVSLSHQIGIGTICEVRHFDFEGNTINYMMCYLNINGRMEGDWIV